MISTPFELEPVTLPPDRHTVERLRAAARGVWLAARTPALLAARLARRRITPPALTLVQRLLVLRTDRIGDMVLSTAALADLRAHFRHARITVLAPEGPVQVLRGHPAVDAVVPLLERRLPPELVGKFDMAIDLTPDERLLGARLAAATGAPWRAGFAAWGRQAFFTLPTAPARQDQHIVDLNRELLRALGIPSPTAEPSLHLKPEERAAAQARAAALGAAAPRVVVHPGAHYASQRWATDRFAEVISRLTESVGAACIVVAGPGEEGLAEAIGAATPDALLPGHLDVRGLMGMIAVADLFLGNNSGPLHIAAALGVPTLSVMGPTDPRRFAPRRAVDAMVRLDLACSPCARARCWHHTCLEKIPAAAVTARARQILAALARREAA
jgi:ADP-heptose:LPS heptosyltransferase